MKKLFYTFVAALVISGCSNGDVANFKGRTFVLEGKEMSITFDAAENKLELLWIDLASCMKLTCFNNRKKMMYRDLALFFHYFEFSETELLDFLQSYLQSNPAIAHDSAELLKKVRANPVR